MSGSELVASARAGATATSTRTSAPRGVQAISSTTSQAGEVLGVPGLGRIQAGAPADLLVFHADPMRDLAAVDTLVAVIAAGRLYERADLETALVHEQAFYEHPWVDAASVWLAQRVAASSVATH